ncbi:MAG: endonuclease/exonuclease/phosphatase family protein [Pseudomonadota bacterium]
MPWVAQAQTVRLATWNAGLERSGPGLVLQALIRGDDPQIEAAVQVILRLDADVLLLTGIDYDHGLSTLAALNDRLAERGGGYPYRFALAPNAGVPTGIDLDGNGRRGEARDAMGWGRFSGAGGMALVSRLAVQTDGVRDFTPMLWRDLPGALIPPDMDTATLAVQRLSTTGHWDVPVTLPDGTALHLLAWAATPPVFDGPEDRNGRRNHDETALWLRLLDGALPGGVPDQFVILGDAKLDPVDGEGRTEAIRSLLVHPMVQDTAPTNGRTGNDAGQRGDPALDTADYGDGVGALRVDYVLPSANLVVHGSGILWPQGQDQFAPLLAAASRHRPVWVDITVSMSALSASP